MQAPLTSQDACVRALLSTSALSAFGGKPFAELRLKTGRGALRKAIVPAALGATLAVTPTVYAQTVVNVNGPGNSVTVTDDQSGPAGNTYHVSDGASLTVANGGSIGDASTSVHQILQSSLAVNGGGSLFGGLLVRGSSAKFGTDGTGIPATIRTSGTSQEVQQGLFFLEGSQVVFDEVDITLDVATTEFFRPYVLVATASTLRTTSRTVISSTGMGVHVRGGSKGEIVGSQISGDSAALFTIDPGTSVHVDGAILTGGVQGAVAERGAALTIRGSTVASGSQPNPEPFTPGAVFIVGNDAEGSTTTVMIEHGTKVTNVDPDGAGLVMLMSEPDEFSMATIVDSHIQGRRYGVRIDGSWSVTDGTAEGSSGTNTLVLDHATVKGDTGPAIQVIGTGTYASITASNGTRLEGGDGVILNAAGNVVVDFTADNSTLTGDITVDSAAANALDVILQNSASLTGDITVDASNGAFADVSVDSGATLTGAAQDVRNVTLDSGSWTMTADSNVLDTLTNAGTIAFQHPGGGGFKTLTTTDYTSNGGALVLNTALGDDNSPTDLLMISGNSTLGTGATQVRVVNAGGDGGETTGDGIKIIDVGGTSDAGAFALGAPAIGGEFVYNLFQNGVADPSDGDWYLRSAGLAPPVPTHEAYPAVLLGLMEPPTLRQRLGNRYYGFAGGGGADLATAGERAIEAQGYSGGRNLWTRIEAAHGHFEGESTTGAEYDTTRYLVQLGVDGMLADNGTGVVIGGLNAQYAHGEADTASDLGNGDISADSYGLGATLTWYGDNGTYIDGQATVAYLLGDLRSDDVGKLIDDNKGWGYGVSLEAGRKFALGGNWGIIPQAQLTYSAVDFDDYTDPFDADVSLESGDSLKGRLGVAFDYDAFDAGSGNRSRVYTVASLTYEFLDGTSVDVDGTVVDFQPDEFGGELGIGGSYEWAGGKYAIHGEALAQTDFGDGYGFKGTAGVTARF